MTIEEKIKGEISQLLSRLPKSMQGEIRRIVGRYRMGAEELQFLKKNLEEIAAYQDEKRAAKAAAKAK